MLSSLARYFTKLVTTYQEDSDQCPANNNNGQVLDAQAL